MLPSTVCVQLLITIMGVENLTTRPYTYLVPIVSSIHCSSIFVSSPLLCADIISNISENWSVVVILCKFYPYK